MMMIYWMKVRITRMMNYDKKMQLISDDHDEELILPLAVNRAWKLS
jgi:hypothetical protein